MKHEKIKIGGVMYRKVPMEDCCCFGCAFLKSPLSTCESIECIDANGQRYLLKKIMRRSGIDKAGR